MALIQLVNETKLKSLKFGNDRPNGGSSGQPFIQAGIPGTGTLSGGLSTITSIISKLPGVTDPGILLATEASIVDTQRLTKFFASTKGLTFTAKQNILSKISVQTEASGRVNDYVYNPLNTITQAGGNVFGLHALKQGLKPLLGLDTPGEPTPERYFDVVKTKIDATSDAAFQAALTPQTQTTSTLAGPIQLSGPFLGFQPGALTPTFVQGTGIIGALPSLNGFDRLIQLYGDTILQGNPGGILRKYSGGPGSLLGIGNTLIRFATSNTGAPLRTNDTPTVGSQQRTAAIYATLGQAEINDLVAASPNSIGVYDFRSVLRNSLQGQNLPETSMASTLAPLYSPVAGQTNLEARVNLNNPAAPGRNLSSYVNGTGVNTYDRINAFPLYRSEIIPADYGPKVNDLVKFRIAAIDNDNPKINEYIHFRAFLGSITDNYNAQWEGVDYMGRGDKLYSYRGFGRTLSLSWMIAAQSKKELIPMYQKLNFLASNLAPDYNNTGYMRGPLVNLTIGGYLYEVPGFITSMTIEMSEEYPWEIGIMNDDTLQSEDKTVKELSQVIRVSSFNFTPIHRFIPRKQVNTYGGDITEANVAQFLATGSKETTAALPGGGKQSVGYVTQFGNTRFISLNAGSQNNYDDSKGIIPPTSM